ncbi:hypothetical protein ACRALDRAFT_212194 [Sodiomyces alcalophilus JCM 7366]|uniref:uncharacterized protein n=1 Tax=Sodiomyces alcalophilus JCM 7366 TaxID=591952 RepID=UPI0039B48F07
MGLDDAFTANGQDIQGWFWGLDAPLWNCFTAWLTRQFTQQPQASDIELGLQPQLQSPASAALAARRQEATVSRSSAQPTPPTRRSNRLCGMDPLINRLLIGTIATLSRQPEATETSEILSMQGVRCTLYSYSQDDLSHQDQGQDFGTQIRQFYRLFSRVN